jgi:transcription antitermination factor NusA-like protein
MEEVSGYGEIFVPVSQECMGIVIGTGGRNIKKLKQETDTRITSCNGHNVERESGFIVTGTVTNCEKVREAIRCRLVSIIIFIGGN